MIVSKRAVLLVDKWVEALLFAVCLATIEPLLKVPCLAQAAETLSWVEINIVGNGSAGPYPLGKDSIISGTAEVWVDSVWVSSQLDYQIDWMENEISFVEPIPVGEEIRLRFQRLDPPLQRLYRHRQMTIVESSSPVSSPILPVESQGEPRGRTIEPAQWDLLQVNGIKSLAVTVGSRRDLSLEQTLRLNISGRIGKDTEVLALLTDQNSPIQPEGNTERLQDLDKVLMQIKKGNFTFLLGDYDLSLTQTELGRYEHKLQGISSQYSSSKLHVTVAGALSRGQFTTNEFRGIESSQGPYQLRAKDGNTNIVVVSGSEKVWFDGKLLKRGENNDYVIEYGNGQITFTPRRLITGDSRITVDFEYSHQRYKKNSWGLRSAVNLWDNKTRIGLTVLREDDDRKNPLDISLTEREKELLAVAGDNSAWVSGVDSSASGRSYYKAVDILITGEPVRYYQFDPRGQSDYNLSFSWVGQGGDYKYVGGGIYEYAGKGNGQYIPGRLLPLPTAHHVEVIDFTVNPAKGIALSGEIGSSGLDLNTFSSRHDEDNVGRAYKLNASLSPSQITLWDRDVGSVALSLRYRSIGEKFRSLGRTSDIEENYRWGLTHNTLAKTSTGQQEEKREASGSYRFTKRSLLNFEYGELRRGRRVRSNRRHVSVLLDERRVPNISYRWEMLSPEGVGDILRQGGKISQPVWKIVPQVHYESEFLSSTSRGEGFQEVGGGISLPDWGPLSWSSQYNRREDQLTAGKGLTFTQQHMLQIKQWRSLVLSTEYSHRRRRLSQESASESEQRTDLASIDIRFAPLKGAVLAEIHSRLSSSGANKKLRNYLYVGKNKGYYLWEDTNGNGLKEEGEFVPDPNGDYILYVEEIGEFQPISELDSGFRLAVEPRKAIAREVSSSWKKILSRFSSNTSFQIQQKNRSADGMSLWKQSTSDTAVVRDRTTFQQDISLFDNSQRFQLRLRHRRDKDLNNEYYSGTDRFSSEENSAKLKARSLKKSTAELEYVKERKSRSSRGSFSDYRIDSNKLRTEFLHCPVPSWEFLLRLQLGEDLEKEGKTRAGWLSFSPGASYRLKGKGKFQTRLDYAHVSSNKPSLIYQMAEGKRKGTNLRWNASFDYRVGQYTSFSLAYDGTKQPKRETIHSLKAEMKAYF